LINDDLPQVGALRDDELSGYVELAGDRRHPAGIWPVGQAPGHGPDGPAAAAHPELVDAALLRVRLQGRPRGDEDRVPLEKGRAPAERRRRRDADLPDYLRPGRPPVDLQALDDLGVDGIEHYLVPPGGRR